MIIKEFRIVIPMSVDEYQIGQLYTIQKKSRIESTGAGSGVEIIENKPYEKINEKGQYTLKVYHVDERLPPSLKTIAKLLFPKSALLFEEESWNAYPYTRTKYHHRLFKSFSIDIESRYNYDYGQSENVFNLSSKELSSRVVDYIDIVNDVINPNEYKEEEDPTKYASKKSQIGPLRPNWLDELKRNADSRVNESSINNQKVKFMCAYKLCRVECAFWGFQSKVEKLITESVLRHMILMSHRQAWCWQDEYLGLTMDDVRRLEIETQEYLKKKMRGELIDFTPISQYPGSKKDNIQSKIEENGDQDDFVSQDELIIDKKDKKKLKDSNEFDNIYNDESDFGDNEEDENDNRSQNSNFEEFYDAISQASVVLSSNTLDSDIHKSINSIDLVSTKSEKVKKRFFSRESKKRNNSDDLSKNSNLTRNKKDEKVKNLKDLTKTTASRSFSKTNESTAIKSDKKCNTDTLILVVHGGNVTCTDTSKQNDFSNFKSTMETMIKTNYGQFFGRIAYRLIPCDSICRDALLRLSALSPVTTEQSFSADDSDDFAEASAAIFSLHENLPFNTLPLLALANQSQYRASLIKFIRESNNIYQQFLNSQEGKNFQGQVVIIGDSLGSLLVYDSLCQSSSINGSDESTLASSISSSQLNINKQFSSSPTPSPNSVRKSDSNIPSPIINVNDKALLDNGIKRNQSNVSSIGGLEFGVNNHSISMEEKLDFDVTHFFVFGSPLGLVLAQRKIANGHLDVPCCSQIYNLFHLTDPIAIRIEPLLCKQFRSIEPCMIPRHSKFPLGDGSNLSLDHFIVKFGKLFDTNKLLISDSNENKQTKLEKVNNLLIQDSSQNLLTPNYDQLKSLQKIIQTKKNWWGENRIDYVLYAPEKIANLPKKSLPYIFHSCYWESTDVVAFVLRNICKFDSNLVFMTDEVTVINDNKEPAEKWKKRLNRVKLRNLSSNHRANDVIVLEDKEQVLSAKFSYGPLDFALSGEKVDIYILCKPSPNNIGEWKFYATELTDNHGKLKYTIPKEKRLSLGVYQIKMIVRCDHTFVEFHMSVLPANTEAVVFSIDGSFAANISFSGTDPKVRPGAVDVVRHWQDLGYLIIYITARPDIQHYKVTNWLAQHNFPLGMIFFSDGISRDPMRQKTETLKNIVNNNNIVLQAGYGSSKDIPMYTNLGVQPNQIFIIGKKNKGSNQAIILSNGYASHLSALQNPNSLFRQANGNARLVIKKGSLNVKQNTIFSNVQTDNSINSPNGKSIVNLNNQYSVSSV